MAQDKVAMVRGGRGGDSGGQGRDGEGVTAGVVLRGSSGNGGG